MPSKDDLLDEPLLSLDEFESYVTELKALQQGKITGVVGSQFWERVTTSDKVLSVFLP
jgi:hypothetical protein